MDVRKLHCSDCMYHQHQIFHKYFCSNSHIHLRFAGFTNITKLNQRKIKQMKSKAEYNGEDKLISHGIYGKRQKHIKLFHLLSS